MAGESPEVLLTRIEGKIDLLNERHTRAVEDINDLRLRVGRHSERIDELTAHRNATDGERRGFEKAVRAIYVLSGAAGLTGIAALAKIFLP